MLSFVYSVKEKEDLHPDLESQGINDDTFCEYRYFIPPPRFTTHSSHSGRMTATSDTVSL